MYNINRFGVNNGRVIKEDGTTVNVGDLLEQLAAGGGGGGGASGENPFNTQSGQTVVSINETYWSRLARHARPIWAIVEGNATGTSGNMSYSVSYSVKEGYLFYPKLMMVHIDVDGIVGINIDIGSFTTNNSKELKFSIPTKAAQPSVLRMDFDGEICVQAGGKCQVGSATTVVGKVYGYIYGYEVSRDV
ncbi:hypothetical protein SAMN02799630_02813 [Paenibacillus sp. UNCCL117]|uniref:hypothetical protein n=1 Tax=unclassified Paenibacillus TaxID=185978 RepID=UPI000890F08F|nr:MULTISPECIES: hypothetical protein [unclassified Paenibacillus]SDD29405.1 hypothetical protein SAMN04488602_107178 [Paenibacillus sp. cl123]SFW40726.1 hypothetical protein SAMN02799630_02813 [Paenibacillus sp. UNCCL117]